MNIRKLTYGGLMTALVFAATFIIRIPVPNTNGGYIHPGDSMIYITAILLGWKYGAFAGGVGSALSDLAAGASVYILPTLIIKSIMGALAGVIASRKRNASGKVQPLSLRNMLSMVVSGLWMVIGYYIAEAMMAGNMISPLTSIPANILQYVGGIIIAAIILIPLGKNKLF